MRVLPLEHEDLFLSKLSGQTSTLFISVGREKRKINTVAKSIGYIKSFSSSLNIVLSLFIATIKIGTMYAKLLNKLYIFDV